MDLLHTRLTHEGKDDMLWPILLKETNFNSNMDKFLYPSQNVQPLKFTPLKFINGQVMLPTLHRACNYLSVLGINLISALAMELRLSWTDSSIYTIGHATSESSVWCTYSTVVAVLCIVCYSFDRVVRRLAYFFLSYLVANIHVTQTGSSFCLASGSKSVLFARCKRASNVYMCSLDATKAVAKVNFVKLFNLLLQRPIPSTVLRLKLVLHTR